MTRVEREVQSLSGPSVLLEIKGLSKSYRAVQALTDVCLDILPGEIHGLVGENGAGKSTIIKLISGMAKPDTGFMIFQSEPYAPNSVLQAENRGIVAVQQEVATFLELTVAENLMVGREPTRLLGLTLDRGKMASRTSDVLDQLDEKIDLRKPLGQISLAQQQMVAIARGLLLESKLLILDEPTASLSEKEAQILHTTIRQLSDKGVAILLVSHRLEEVLELCQRITVLRDGKLVETDVKEKWDRPRLISAMVGRHVEESFEENPDISGQSILKVNDLTVAGKFGPVSFDVYKGEILGLGGLVGSGRTEIARAVFGLDTPDQGAITFEGKSLVLGSVEKAISAGIAMVPEDRQHEGLVLDLPVETNLALVCRKRWAKSGLINKSAELRSTIKCIEDLKIKVENPSLAVNNLSGGNQQKVVIGKWLASEPKLLILDEPTRGVDVGSKVQIHNIIRKLAAEGLTVIVISSDLPELVALSQRVLVIESGLIAGELSRSEITAERVLDFAFARGAKS